MDANDEAGAFIWTVYETADRLGARGGIQMLGTGMRPTAWPRSVRRVRLQHVGDWPTISISIDRAELLPAPLLLCFKFEF